MDHILSMIDLSILFKIPILSIEELINEEAEREKKLNTL